jgi:hypothetical protein
MEEFTKEAIFGWGNSQALAEAKATSALTPKGGIMMGASMRNIAPLLGLAGLVALGTTAAKVGLGALSDVKTKGDLIVSFNNIFREYPELKEEKGQVAKFFAMMSKYAPDLATNPIVAGTWIKQVMNQNVVDPKNIASLMDAQNSWEEIRSMKSPLVGFTQELPRAETIFTKTLMTPFASAGGPRHLGHELGTNAP